MSGNGTKLVICSLQQRVYAVLRLGINGYQDISGTVLELKRSNGNVDKPGSDSSFVGEQLQHHPLFALKVNGKKLYELPRGKK